MAVVAAPVTRDGVLFTVMYCSGKNTAPSFENYVIHLIYFFKCKKYPETRAMNF